MSDEINRRLQELKTALDPKVLAQVAYKEFYSVTPQRTGNAKRNTNLRTNQIDANYPYATNLDEGASKQAPKGMTEPTIRYVEKYIKKQEK